MKPIVRCIVSTAVFAITVAPIAVVWGNSEAANSKQQQAENEQNRRLDAVAKDYLADNCYTTAAVTNGATLKLPDPVPASSCVTDGDRVGFLAVLDGHPRIFDVFPQKRVNARASEILKTSPNK